jgi:predicted phosphodiesterase
MGFAKKIKAGYVIHCGDWANFEAVKTVESYKIPVYGVIGNADIDDSFKNRFKDFLKIEIEDRKIGIIHDVKKLEEKDLDIVFFGHWQKQKDTFWNGIRAVNPGALENDVNFAVYDTTSGKIEFINE